MDILNSLNFYKNNFRYYYGYDKNSTFVRGFFKQNYKFSRQLSEQELLSIDKTVAISTYLALFVSVVMFLIYFYGVFFNRYFELINKAPIVFALSISIPAVICIGIPYIIADFWFKRYLKKFGEYVQEKDEYKIPVNAADKTIPGFERIKARTVKETILGFVLVFLFLCFALFIGNSAEITAALIRHGNYSAALKIANLSVKIIPISSRLYGYRGTAKFYNKDYKGAIEDYKIANKYSDTEFYDEDLFLAKSKILSKQEMIDEYDKSINAQKEQIDKYTAMFAKANYLFGIKDYKSSYEIYNVLVNAYKNKEHMIFSPDKIYIRRALSNKNLGKIQEYKSDLQIAKSMCPDCQYDKITEQKLEPLPSINY